jgi:xanthine/uracil/vitamin C permease (AzgA family)
MAFIGLSAVGSLFWSWIADYISLALTMAIAGGISIFFSLWFEKYRPIVRRHARPIYIKKGIIKEIAEGLEAAEG